MTLSLHVDVMVASYCLVITSRYLTLPRLTSRVQVPSPALKIPSGYAHFADKAKKVAAKLGATCEFITVGKEEEGARFIAELEARLKKGLPAVLSVWDTDHWIALLVKDDERKRFLVMDPINDEKDLEYWTPKKLLKECWCKPDDGPHEYFGILVDRSDGKPPRRRLTKRFLKLLQRGSEQTAQSWHADLVEIAARSSNGKHDESRHSDGAGAGAGEAADPEKCASLVGGDNPGDEKARDRRHLPRLRGHCRGCRHPAERGFRPGRVRGPGHDVGGDLRPAGHVNFLTLWSPLSLPRSPSCVRAFFFRVYACENGSGTHGLDENDRDAVVVPPATEVSELPAVLTVDEVAEFYTSTHRQMTCKRVPL